MAEENNNQEIKSKSKKILFFAAIGLIFFAAGFLIYKEYFEQGEASGQIAQSEEANNIKNKEIFDVEYIVQEGDTLSLILESLNTKNEERIKIIEAFEKIYSPTKIKTGNAIKIKFEEDKSSVGKMEYAISAEKVLIITKKAENEWDSEEKEIVFDVKIASKGAKIKSSLFETGSEIGLSAATILLMADVFSGEIDFATDIQEGDSFKIIYEEKYPSNSSPQLHSGQAGQAKDGALALDGNILAAEFQNQGQTFRTFYFEDPGNISSYFDEKGRSLKKAFLKSPLNYRYISSGYTNARIHPILKIVTSHRAIDYVAAAGTPVVTVGDGKIMLTTWRSDYGNYVAVRHSNGYVTYYGHLSGFAKGIRAGISVLQGQTIGYVGSTGFSTGAHLDYSMKLNGAYINPLAVNIVVGDPVSESSKEVFSAYAEKMIKLLEGI
ncbi:M23 family metallopeptidase [Patescibacteria group bacterium]|nr:M23 family metallopeptidase [Patescibacteria group bacterium]MBU4141346.1 M23 family metallopeptidase [Patescibacteria group bacterium]